METRFGRDFSGVRVHTGTDAGASAAELRAAAYTAGSSIVFRQGRYAPRTAAGKDLLAHELAHVVQQRQAPSLLPVLSAPGGELETAATRAAAGAADLREPAAAPVPAIQRQPDVPHLEITKSAGLVATEDEVEAKLTEFLTRVMRAQGGRELRDSPAIAQALQTLAEGDIGAVLRVDAFLAQGFKPGSPAEYASAARGALPSRILKSQLARLDKIPSAPSTLPAPRSVGEALGHAVLDKTIGPVIRALPVSKELQAKIYDAAVSAVASGVAALADPALSNAHLDPQSKAAVSAAIEAAIKQKPGVTPPRPPPGLGAEPPSRPPEKSPTAPGEKTVGSPKIDIPDVPGAPKQSAPVAPTPQSVEQVIQGISDDALIPAQARGTPAAESFSGARDFARALAAKLDAAQTANNYSVEIALSSTYRQAGDLRSVFDEAERIAKLVAEALPHHASKVEQVIINVASPDPKKPSFVRRVVRLH
jgi:Domain of unknown function (DUF4157)